MVDLGAEKIEINGFIRLNRQEKGSPCALKFRGGQWSHESVVWRKRVWEAPWESNRAARLVTRNSNDADRMTCEPTQRVQLLSIPSVK